MQINRYLLILLLLILFRSALAQTDTEFWFVAPEISKNGVQQFDLPIYLRISTDLLDATVTITQPANSSSFPPITVTIPANGFSTVNLSPFIEMVENKPANSILNYGLHIVSTNPVTIYYEIASTYCMCNPELYTLKGKNALGMNFLIPTQNYFNNHPTYDPVPYNAFDIVATENNTVVTIIPTKEIIGHPAGIPFQVALNEGQTYSAVATSQYAANHLFGSVVSATKPVAITMSDDLLFGISGCADVIGDQIVPLELTGMEYIAVRGNLTNNGNRAFILATEDNTNIFIDGISTPAATLNKGAVYNHNILNPSTFITSDKPVYVFQTSGFGCELGGAILPPTYCTGSSRVSFFRTTAQQLGVILFTSNGNQGNFLLNGNPSLIVATDFNEVPGTGGQWVAASLIFSEFQIPVGTSVVVENTTSKFHLGLMIGNPNDGCSYGYFSSFASLNLGPDVTLCSGIPKVLDAGPGRGTYTWYYNNTIIPGAVSQTYTVTTTGTYKSVVTENSCLLQDEINVNYYPPLNPDLGNDITQCQTGSPIVLSPTGGPYSGYLWFPGGETTPSITVTSSGNYKVNVTDNNNCQAGSNTVTITLYSVPEVNLAPFQPVCSNIPPFILTGGTPPGGSYSGNGVNSLTGIFDPSFPGAGELITYTYTDAFGCTSSATSTLTVNNVPSVSLNPFTAVCSNQGSFTLTGGSPPGGTFSGNGVTGGMFDPALAGMGISDITYTIPNQYGCVASAVQPLLVNPSPEAILTSTSPVCINTPPFQVTGNPSGGIFSGTGVGSVSGLFSPAAAGAGIHEIIYTVTHPTGCSGSDTNQVEVLALASPQGTITPTGIFCQGDQPGTFTIVNPDPVATSFTWTLMPVNAGTLSGTTSTVTVSWNPAFTETATIGFQPNSVCGAGSWSPFQPVIINPKPVVSFTPCCDRKTTKNAKPIFLKGGLPAGPGGVYSGTGVSQSPPGTFIFDPSNNQVLSSSQGVPVQVTYRYTNHYQCYQEKEITITVYPSNASLPCPGVLTDIRDGRSYNIFLAGSGSSARCWMAENLQYGDSIDWMQHQSDNCLTEKYCTGNQSSQCAINGGYYQWNELMTYRNSEGIQGICPPGWHIPAISEWNDLAVICQGPGRAGRPLMDVWLANGFHALLSGILYSGNSWAFFSGSNKGAMFWTSSQPTSLTAFARGLNSMNPSLSLYPSGLNNAFPVRCIKD